MTRCRASGVRSSTTRTVLVWAVPVVAVVAPMAIVGIYMRRRNVYDLHHANLGLLFSVLITAVLTDAIKDGVGRPRPNFFWHCFPDGAKSYDNVTREVICHGDPGMIKEGYKSFPSSHTSWSFAGLGFLSWYLAGKIKVFDRGGHIAKLCIIAAPLLLAAMVAVSWLDDYWQHGQDVFNAGVLGTFSSRLGLDCFMSIVGCCKLFWFLKITVSVLTVM